MIKTENNGMAKVVVALLVVFGLGIICAGLVTDCIVTAWMVIAIGFVYTITLVLRYGVRWWRYRHGKVAAQERFLLFLVSLMMFFLVTGTALHMWAFSCEIADNGATGGGPFVFINAEYLLRSLACSFMLFTGNIDSTVMDGIREHQYVKGLISVQTFLSFMCTAAVFISMVYARMSAYYRLHRMTRVNQQHNHLYVFWGMNEPSRLLAKSIKEKEEEQSVVMFVENSHVDDSDQSGWNGIVGMLTHRRQTFSYADDLGARVTFTETRLCDIDKGISDGKTEVDILGESNLLKLRAFIRQLGSNITDAQLHIFFLSENEDENIRALSTLALDNSIHLVRNITRFYCHARKNGLNRVVEDIATRRGLEVRVIDSSYMAVELLKVDERNHPVRLVDIDKKNPATVSSPFSSLIVGFDEAGRDALKFLYEFGAFVDVGATPESEGRSPFRCVVVDSRMDELAGIFSTFSPTVMRQTNKDGSKLVELRQCDCRSSEFFKEVVDQNFCKQLNYIVIAVGDDETGMLLAIRLLNHIRRVRADLSRLRIYVRCYKGDREAYMQQIANYYNEVCNMRGQTVEPIIIPFGQKEHIYSYDMIVNEALTEKGKRFQAEYARLKGEKKLWDERRKEAQEAGTLDSMRELRRKEAQDLANALHAGTKLYMLKQSMPDGFDWDYFLSRYFDENDMVNRDGSFKSITYPLLDRFENKTILNLARLEHLRWIASHEMLGYIKGREGLHSSDERTCEHNCLRPWQELDDESKATQKEQGWDCDYKAFDFCVVDNTIMLNKNSLSVQ